MPDLTPAQEKPGRRIYLAAPYTRRAEMAGYAGELRALGHVVTSRWHNEGGTPLLGAGTEEECQLASRYAREDIQDTEDSEIFIAFTATPMASEVTGAGAVAQDQENGGTHVEFGIAIALGKDLWVVGPRENVFHCLPTVRVFPDWGSVLTELKDLAGVKWAEAAATQAEAPQQPPEQQEPPQREGI